MSNNQYVVIMAGGIGTRFWPYSRNNKPKQFLDILGVGRSLLQMTFDRFNKKLSHENIFVVTSTQYATLVKEQLPQLTADQILCEPERRNTAPCIAYAAYKIKQKNPYAVMVVTPADHTIFMEELFYQSIDNAVEAASTDNKLITIGIQPTRPETGYGYIQYIEDDAIIKRVKTFTEKPQLDLALKFIESGDFVWNAGIFVWSISSIVEAFELYLPEISELFKEGENLYFTENENAFIANVYAQCKSISVDYGIMEAAKNVFVVLGEFTWSDVGSWNSLHEMLDKDSLENVVDANTLLYNCKGNYIKAKKNKVLVIQDLEGYLVADFDDVLLICKKDQDVKFREFYSDVKNKKGEKYM